MLANPVGLSSAVLSSDGFLIFGRRNDRVAYYPGRIHPFAGAAEPAESLDLFAEVRRELTEELRFQADDILDLRCAALVEDRSLRQPELIFRCRSTRSRDWIIEQLDQAEHHSAWYMPANANGLAAALADSAHFTPVAIATLLVFGKAYIGDEWFNVHARAFT